MSRNPLLLPRRTRTFFSVLVLTLLAACGGGSGGDLSPPSTPLTHGDSPRAQAAAVPKSYSMRMVQLPMGALQLFPSPHEQAILNVKGQFIGMMEVGIVYDPQTETATPLASPSPGVTVFPTGLNDSGLVAGVMATSGDDASGFSWTPSTGAVTFDLSQSEVNGAFIASDGFVGGRDNRFVCGSYTWELSTSTLLEYPDFCMEWMNRAGTMLGSRNGVLQILSRDGQFRTVDPSLPLQSSFSGFLTDDDQVFLHLGAGQDTGQLQPGAVVIGSAGAVNIGRGLLAAPPGAQLLGEMAVLYRVSSTGHAIGNVRYDLEFDDRCLGVPDVSLAFHWSAASGATALQDGGRTIELRDVNRDGIVIGRSSSLTVPLDRYAFAFTVDTGVVRLDDLVSNLPDGVTLFDVGAIGDGGHILAWAHQGTSIGWALLTPIP